MAQEFDWSKFTLRIYINSDLAKIYYLWTTQDGLEQWFLRKAEASTPDKSIRNRETHMQKDDTFTWMWHGWGDELAERGTVLEANGKDYIKFTFGNAGTVSVKIIKEAGVSLIELKQEDIPIDEKSKVSYHLGCNTGWRFYMVNLKSIVEGGIDLRNKDINLKAVVNS
jgi:uncharacterized protein YndB with AHSA1/START domain